MGTNIGPFEDLRVPDKPGCTRTMLQRLEIDFLISVNTEDNFMLVATFLSCAMREAYLI